MESCVAAFESCQPSRGRDTLSPFMTSARVGIMLAGTLSFVSLLPQCGGSDDAAEDDTSAESEVRSSDSPSPNSERNGGETTAPRPPETSSGCGNQLSGTACVSGQSCSWIDSEHCIEGECSCSSGSYTCYSRTSSSCNDPGTVCPDSRETRCGDSCEGTIENCLCRCGGGPNYASCACSGAAWECNSCQGG